MLTALVLVLSGCHTRDTTEAGGAPEPTRVAPARPRLPEGPGLEYTLRFPDRASHYVDVEMIVPGEGEVDLFMAVWTPGSYLVREYARHVEDLRASKLDGTPLDVEKIRKNRWRVSAGDASRVVVRYRVYGREMTVRTNFVDADLAVLNGASTFLTLDRDRALPHDVELELPAGWSHSVTGLRRHEDGRDHHYVAASYDELVDSPIVAGNPTLRRFEVEGVEHTLALFGELSAWDVERTAEEVAALATAQVRFWGVVPYDHYAFINLAVGGGGGLEHKNSTLMISSPFVTRRDKSHRRWLGLVSHEFFHTWNVKRLRPEALGPFDYENEVYTRSLWVAEGITSYYDDLLLRRAGLLDRDQYLEALSSQIQSLQNTPGRSVQSLANASYDAWIKYYRPDENSHNTAVSYYTKGAVVAFLLDAEIRRLSRGKKSLDDVMRRAYERFSGERGFRPEEFRALASEVAGADLSAFFASAVDGTDELDYQPALDTFGLRLERPDAEQDDEDDDKENDADDKENDADDKDDDEERGGYLGARVSRGVITRVPRDSPAHRAGLNVDDEILAIDGFRVRDLDTDLERYRPGDVVELTIARRRVLQHIDVTLGSPPDRAWKLSVDDGATIGQRLARDAWLDTDLVVAPAPEIVAESSAEPGEAGATGTDGPETSTAPAGAETAP